MKYEPITSADQELIVAAMTVIANNFLYKKHHVGAAVRGRSGKIYVGVHLESKITDVCAEQVAMGIAATNGEREFDSIVAVQMRDVPKPTVISPCAVCQELISFYGPEIWVILEIDGEFKKARIKDF